MVVYTKQAEKWKKLIFIRGVQQLLSLQSINFIYYWHIINDEIYFYLILCFTSVSLCHYMFYELSEPQHPIDWGTLNIQNLIQDSRLLHNSNSLTFIRFITFFLSFTPFNWTECYDLLVINRLYELNRPIEHLKIDFVYWMISHFSATAAEMNSW